MNQDTCGQRDNFQKKLLLLDDVPVAVDLSYTLHSLGKVLAPDLQQRLTFPTLEQYGVVIDTYPR
jgi:GntR family transcriptional regulator